ncbi:unnamed protein product [Brassica napus]|uniref:(rape) hypothetical protein n=1 Tax=Brassica napus TaxID=3708 RepID=A0A816I3X6_BRANA|nr:unnamed protein product [Brassica napus]
MLPFFDIEVMTFERSNPGLHLDYFSFTQDDRLKVHIADGIKYIRDITNS